MKSHPWFNTLTSIEQQVLHHCLRGGLTSVLDAGITSEMFIDTRALRLFNAMLENDKAGLDCDLAAIGPMIQSEVNLMSYLVDCDGLHTTTRNMDYFLGVIKNSAKRRKYAAHLDTLLNDDLKTGPLSTFEFESKVMSVLSEQDSCGKIDSTQGGLLEATEKKISDDITKIALGEEISLSTGIEIVDTCIDGGFQPGELITIAARTGCGKTAIATNMALNMAKNGHHPLYITIELNSLKIMERLICTQAEIDTGVMKSRMFSKDDSARFESAKNVLRNLKLSVASKTGCSWAAARSNILNGVRFKGVDVVFIDYIQQFRYDDQKGLDIRKELINITRESKQLSVDLNIPVIILAQMNRDVDKRIDKTPTLADLKESGSIEQDSDIVLFLSYQTTTEKRCDGDTRDVTELWLSVGKNRAGKFRSTPIKADLSINKFY